jgi:hypothetical protein
MGQQGSDEPEDCNQKVSVRAGVLQIIGIGDDKMEEIQETVTPETPVVEKTVKRKYVKMSDGDFLAATHKVETIKELMALTGMSYVGVKNKLKSLVARKVSIKKSLLVRQGKK